MAEGQLIFISGGVRSGKSAYAESLILDTSANRSVYLASGQAYDSEMEKRIDRHREDRENKGWSTIEQPVDLHLVLPQLHQGDAVLWDCVTTWLANELYRNLEQKASYTAIPEHFDEKWQSLQHTIKEILDIADLLVIVSNEVMDDCVRDKQYQQWLGKIHRWLVAEADVAIEMENGMAFKRK